MIAVIAGALALFCLGLAAVATGRGRKWAIGAAIACAVIGTGLAVAGAIRYADCKRSPRGWYNPNKQHLDRETDQVTFEDCPNRLLGISDPF
jgi:hypothetical protein